MVHTLAIIQARTLSSRLPGKVLLDIAGQPMLVRVVERVKRAVSLNDVVVATTTDPSDDAIKELCVERGYSCFRGSAYDVLDRYYQTARTFRADVIVRVTGDCPLIDPVEIDHTVQEFFKAEVDFAANRLPPPWKRTYPIGLDVEVCTFEALEFAWKEADKPRHREHVMPYLYEEKERFRTLVLNHDTDYGNLRLTVDTPEDLELVRQIYAHFSGSNDISWMDVVALFDRRPELAQINSQVKHKTVHDVDGRNKTHS